MFSKIAIVALFAGLVASQDVATPKPNGPTSGFNPINRPLNEIVPACQPFVITWTPTTSNPVSLVLLKGPSNNVVPNGPPLAVGVSNSGSFSWTPSSSLEATQGPNGYGLQIIDQITGDFQYSTQFGVSKGPACNSYSTPAPSSTVYGGGRPVSTKSSASMASASAIKSMQSAIASIQSEMHSKISSVKANATTVVTKASGVASHAPVYSTGMPAGNSSIIQPTKSLSIPASLMPTASATTSRIAESTGGAASIKAGLGMVGAAAAFALML